MDVAVSVVKLDPQHVLKSQINQSEVMQRISGDKLMDYFSNYHPNED